jgi:hypothetical protein
MDLANLLPDGSGEGALLMTEQFAFQKIEGNSRAIQLDKRTSASRACIVDGMGNQLLAGAGLTLNQNRGVSGRNTFHLSKHGFKRRAVPDNLLECALGLVPPRVSGHTCTALRISAGTSGARPINLALTIFASTGDAVHQVEVQPEHSHPAAGVATFLLHPRVEARLEHRRDALSEEGASPSGGTQSGRSGATD